MAIRLIGSALIAVLTVAGYPCAAQTVPGSPVVIAPQPSGSMPLPDVAGTVGVGQDYRLGLADHVRVNVYNEPDLSGEFTVNANGVIPVPLIGDVSVVGATLNEVATKIQQKLANGFLKDPHVSLEVLTYRPFYIMGEVARPSEYPYSNGITVLNAVAAAGGFTYRADRRKVFIRHAGSDSDAKVRITPGLQIAPGDTIRIPERYF